MEVLVVFMFRAGVMCWCYIVYYYYIIISYLILYSSYSSYILTSSQSQYSKPFISIFSFLILGTIHDISNFISKATIIFISSLVFRSYPVIYPLNSSPNKTLHNISGFLNSIQTYSSSISLFIFIFSFSWFLSESSSF